jgi:ribose transport system permease protein
MDKKTARSFLWKSNGLFQTLGVFIFLFIAMSLVLPRFLTITNQLNLIRQMAVNLIVAAGMTFLILTGEFDISVGAVLALTASVAGKLIPTIGTLPGCMLALLIGPAFGLFHGVIVTKAKIPSFIATLGSMMMARSLAFVVTKGQIISNLPESFKFLGQGSLGGVPFSLFIVIAIYCTGFFVLTKSPFGNKVYAIGSNRKIASLFGIQADRVKTICFIIVGALTSFSGIVLLSRIAAIQADTARGLEFDVIAAVVIGGTSLYGGEGNILQTIIGVIIIGLIHNFLNLSHINIFWQEFATGLMIIIAVLIDALRKRIALRT